MVYSAGKDFGTKISTRILDFLKYKFYLFSWGSKFHFKNMTMNLNFPRLIVHIGNNSKRHEIHKHFIFIKPQKSDAMKRSLFTQFLNRTENLCCYFETKSFKNSSHYGQSVKFQMTISMK